MISLIGMRTGPDERRARAHFDSSRSAKRGILVPRSGGKPIASLDNEVHPVTLESLYIRAVINLLSWISGTAIYPLRVIAREF